MSEYLDYNNDDTPYLPKPDPREINVIDMIEQQDENKPACPDDEDISCNDVENMLLKTVKSINDKLPDANGHIELVGINGESAYAIAVRNGFVGTEEEWLDSLHGGAVSAENVPYQNVTFGDVTNVDAALTKLFSKVYYVAPNITSFTSTPSAGNREIGSSISSIEFAWTINKGVIEQTLTGCTPTATDRSATYSTATSANKTFTLSVKDEDGGTTSKSLSFNFLPKVYYGSKALADVDSDYVVSLSKGDLKSGRSGTYSITVASGQYGIIAFPTSFGVPNCKIGGFDTDLTLIDTVSVTNASGYTQDYRVYRTPNPSLGAISMVIS